MTYYITYFLTKVLSFFYFPYKTKGTENIPRTGGFILASNHVSNLDPVVLGICSVRRLNFMAKIELFKGALGGFLKRLGAFPVKRGKADLGAVKEAIKRLKKGQPVLIFVEGTRRLDDTPIQAQSGAGFITIKAGVRVVPVYLKGTDKVMAPGTKFFTRGIVEATFGKPFEVAEAASYQEASQRILDEIYKLA